MKKILFRKYADIIGQALMTFPVIFIVSPDNRGTAMATYFTVGAWQTVSCAITAWAGTGHVDNSRKQYSKALVWIFGILALSILILLVTAGSGIGHDPLLNTLRTLSVCTVLLEAFIMLFAGPAMAIWYAGITLTEIRLIRKAIQHRSEIHWKL